LEDTTAPISVLDLFTTVYSDAAYSDIDGPASFAGIVVVENNAVSTDGDWQYSSDGFTWYNIGAVNPLQALSLGKNALVQFSPAADFFGQPEPLVIQAIDGNYSGPLSSTTNPRVPLDINNLNLSDEHTISIEVLPVNDEPQGSDSTIQIAEDTTYAFSVQDFGFSDIENHIFTGIVVSEIPNTGILLNNGSIVNQNDWISRTAIASGDLVYNPLPNHNGVAADFWQFAVTDNGGNIDGGIDQQQTTNTITVDISPVNDQPIASGSTLTVVEVSDYQIELSDIGFSDPIEQNSLEEITILSLPLHGTLYNNAIELQVGDKISSTAINSGLFTYQSVSIDATDQVSFDFTATDDGGNVGTNSSQSPSAIVFNIIADNNPPIGANNTVTLNEDSEIALTPELFGFTDPADDDLMSGILITNLPNNGELYHNGASLQSSSFISIQDLLAERLVFYPAPNEHGENYTQFNFKVFDDGSDRIGKNESLNEYILAVSVLPVNDIPTNLEITGNLSINETVDGSLDAHDPFVGDVSFTDIDLNQTNSTDSHVLSVDDQRFEIVNGKLSLKQGAVLDFESESEIPLEITATDNAGDSTTQAIILQIQNVNEAPVIANPNDPFFTTPTLLPESSDGFSFQVPAEAFFDVDGDELTLSVETLPEWLSFDPSSETFTVTGDAPAGITTITLIANDSQQQSTSTTIDLEVAEPTLAPALPVLTATTTQDSEEQPEQTTEEIEETEIDESEPLIEEELISADSAEELAPASNEIPEVVQLESNATVTRNLVNTLDEIGIIHHNDNTEAVLNIVAETIEQSSKNDVSLSSEFSLDRLKQFADEANSKRRDNAEFIIPAAETSVIVSSSLSVGYVLWLLRSGTMLASVMATLPAWRTFDPLPVLDTLEGSADSDDNETLESMVDNSANDDDIDQPPEEKSATSN